MLAFKYVLNARISPLLFAGVILHVVVVVTYLFNNELFSGYTLQYYMDGGADEAICVY